jgi:uncharacterized protein YdaL
MSSRFWRRETIMLKRSTLLLAGFAAVAACDISFDGGHAPRQAALDRATATTAIWNPSPGDPALGASARSTMESFAPGALAPFAGGSAYPAANKKTLVLYDKSGTWGALGELYAVGSANLASHFGSYVAKPAVSYVCGELGGYDAVLYIGSSYDEPLPTCLLDNVLATSKPVIWSFYNIWKLEARAGGPTPFATKYGWNWTPLDFSPVGHVTYKGHVLDRYAANGGGLMGVSIGDATRVSVLATAQRDDGTSLPWAIRSGNFTYVVDIPFTYMTEEDRYLVYADLLFDALAPTTTERHRVVVRLEDISPEDDPAELRAAADYLYSQHVPFGFGVIAQYEDPLGWYNGGIGERVRLDQSPELVSAVKYAQTRGGVLVMHGFTHQYKSVLNPYTAVTGDDMEFYRVIENTDHSLTYSGPVPNDSTKYTSDRITSARKNFQRAGVSYPMIWEFPHYAASANDYKAVNAAFATRWERSLYFPGTLAGTTPSYTRMFGQLFPYPVRDIYGTRVVPENLGNIEPEPFYTFPTRFPADIVNAAEKNLVVRDGTVGFYFHPFFDLAYLRDTVQGLRTLGYEFVSPTGI